MLISPYPSSNLNTFQYGRFSFDYHLVYEDRENLAITIRPDKSIMVKVPFGTQLDVIQTKLEKRGKWILQQVNYFDKFHPFQPPCEYVGGETHYYLGRQYRLKIDKSDYESVKLIGKFFVIETKNRNDFNHIKLMLDQWYADHAELMLGHCTERHIKKILGANFENIEIRYRFLKRRWGNCDPDGIITFNIELVKAPIQCIDYVIVHELCHLVYPNHDKAFYDLLAKTIPEWREMKEKLELFGVK